MLSLFVFYILLVRSFSASKRSKRYLRGYPTAYHKTLVISVVLKYPYGTEYPYTVQLTREPKYSCSAVLIKPNFALTIASCISNEKVLFQDILNYTLVAGNQLYADHSSSFVQVRQLEKFVLHPGALDDPFKYGIAMLKVVTPFVLNNYVNVAKLPQKDEMNRFSGALIVSLGWGATDTGNHTEYLQKIYGRIYDCKLLSVLCVRGLYGGFPQKGDGGGPVVVEGKEREDDLVVGLTNFLGTDPKFYLVNCAFFSDWIEATIANMS